MKNFNDFITNVPFWKKVWFSILVCCIFGFACNIKEILNNDIISTILEFIFFLIGFMTMDKYAYWLYKTNFKTHKF